MSGLLTLFFVPVADCLILSIIPQISFTAVSEPREREVPGISTFVTFLSIILFAGESARMEVSHIYKHNYGLRAVLLFFRIPYQGRYWRWCKEWQSSGCEGRGIACVLERERDTSCTPEIQLLFFHKCILYLFISCLHLYLYTTSPRTCTANTYPDTTIFIS